MLSQRLTRVSTCIWAASVSLSSPLRALYRASASRAKGRNKGKSIQASIKEGAVEVLALHTCLAKHDALMCSRQPMYWRWFDNRLQGARLRMLHGLLRRPRRKPN